VFSTKVNDIKLLRGGALKRAALVILRIDADIVGKGYLWM
jgi:hypothetical protein